MNNNYRSIQVNGCSYELAVDETQRPFVERLLAGLPGQTGRSMNWAFLQIPIGSGSSCWPYDGIDGLSR